MNLPTTIKEYSIVLFVLLVIILSGKADTASAKQTTKPDRSKPLSYLAMNKDAEPAILLRLQLQNSTPTEPPQPKPKPKPKPKPIVRKVANKKTRTTTYKKPVVRKPVTVAAPAYIKKRICEVFGSQCNNALIIAKYESSFRTGVISRTGDYGLFQINCRWQGHRVGGNCSALLDLETNLRVAKQIFNEQGWNPWYTKKFL